MKHIDINQYYNAYFIFRKHCRKSSSQIIFESDFRYNLHLLRESVINQTVDLGESNSFIVTKPKPREVFAGSINKRILDTLVVMFLRPTIESILPDRMYNCRKGKGLNQYRSVLKQDMIDSYKEYGNDSWIFGGDIKSFFMSLNKDIVWNEWKKVIDIYSGDYKEELNYIIKLLIYYEPENHSIRKSPISMWNLIPSYKSLYTNGKNKGLPIGDLVLQWSALLILKDFGNCLKARYKYIGIYMDDFYIIGKHSELLKAVEYSRNLLLKKELCLKMDKIYFQPAYHGIKTCGAVVYKDRSYIANRVVNNTYRFIISLYRRKISAESTMMTLNSYFGIMQHFCSYNIRTKLIKILPHKVFNKLYIQGHYKYFKLKRYDSKDIS